MQLRIEFKKTCKGGGGRHHHLVLQLKSASSGARQKQPTPNVPADW